MNKEEIMNVLFLLLAGFFSQAIAWTPEAVFRDPQSGKLVYTLDNEGHRIPDFSYAGYKNSEEPIPVLPATDTINGPSGGDDQPMIQATLDAIGVRTPNAEGIRGVLLLRAGNYQLNSSLIVEHSGVILRGEGQDASGTVLDFGSETLGIRFGGGQEDRNWRNTTGTAVDIITNLVRTGDRHFVVADPAEFSVGDQVVIRHLSTADWIEAIHYGGVDDPNELWEAGDAEITYNRFIQGIQGDTIFIDAPVFNNLDASLSVSTLQKYDDSDMTQFNGLENLRITFDANKDIENYGVIFKQTIDSWAKNVTLLNITRDGFQTNTALRITIDSTEVVGYSHVDRGSWAYLYNLDDCSQLVLISHAKASEGRHNYISNGTSSVSGCVFHKVESGNAKYNSEGHRLWSQGLLYDQLEHTGSELPGNDRVLAFMNRGASGSGHGWSTVNSVAWNCDLNGGDFWMQKPPTAQNWSIGTKGNVLDKGFAASSQPGEEWVEEPGGGEIDIPSLFLAQLEERLQSEAPVSLQNSKEIVSNSITSTGVILKGDLQKSLGHNVFVTNPTSQGQNLRIMDLQGRSLGYQLIP